jgi:hypothetical protein
VNLRVVTCHAVQNHRLADMCLRVHARQVCAAAATDFHRGKLFNSLAARRLGAFAPEWIKPSLTALANQLPTAANRVN